MLAVAQRLADRPPALLAPAVKEVLLNALAELEQQAVGSAQLIRLRFLDGLPATATANRMNLTENVVYKQQATAVEVVYTRQARYDLAQESLQRSVALYAQLEQPVDQANAEGNLAEAYIAEQEWEAASRILHQAVARLTGLEPTPRITNLLAEIDTLVQRAAAGSFQEAEP